MVPTPKTTATAPSTSRRSPLKGFGDFNPQPAPHPTPPFFAHRLKAEIAASCPQVRGRAQREAEDYRTGPAGREDMPQALAFDRRAEETAL